MRRFTIRLVTTVVLSLGSVASAGLGPNGLGPNGLGPNGLGPNGLGPNGLGPNGLGPNGLGPNGLGPNGLGPNGLGPNGLGPNGLDVNGLGPNGLGPNGLGPNGIGITDIYVITPDGTQGPSTFREWFEGAQLTAAERAERVQFMRYFARCAYDGVTAIAYQDSTGKTWAWTGQYGLAMTSTKTIVYDAAGAPVGRARMTVDEGKWVSSCLLAHVNTQGTHQYLSLRGSPPNAEAQAALLPTANEEWIMGKYRFGAFLADLFPADTAAPNLKYACAQDGTARALFSGFWHKEDSVLGRTCDVGACPALTDFLGYCFPVDNANPNLADYLAWIPAAYSVPESNARYQLRGASFAPPDRPPADLNAIFVNGPLITHIGGYKSPLGGIPHRVVADRIHAGGYAFAFDVAACNPAAPAVGLTAFGSWTPQCTSGDDRFTLPISDTQTATCVGLSCLSGDSYATKESYKLTALADGQAIDVGIRFTPDTPQSVSDSPVQIHPDMNEPLTALIRYSKDRTGAAEVWASDKDGDWRSFTDLTNPGTGPDVWSATGVTPAGHPAWEWLQVYPVYLHHDGQSSSYLGKYCTIDDDCDQGRGFTCGGASPFGSSPSVCIAPAIPADPATPAPSSCPAGGPPTRLVEYDAGPVCVEQCVSDSQCPTYAVCVTGQCVNPAAKIRIAGAVQGESCTGPELFRGDGERSTCSRFYFDWQKKRITCRKSAEPAPACRGSLVFYVNSLRDYGWKCVDGGKAVRQCLAADAPDLDGVGFIPGKPWCAPAGTTSFIGVCK